MSAGVAQARAVDALLSDITAPGLPGDPSEWLSWNGTAYVIPRRLGHGAVLVPKDDRSYERRGLIFNRVVPVDIDGYSVRVVLVRAVSLGEKPPESLGAALFEDFELNVAETSPGRFVASEARCPNQAVAIAQQVHAARRDSCFAAVWPELTLTPERREGLRSILGEWNGSTDAMPMLAVAGSWHEQDGSALYNLSHVYDAFGRIAVTVRKAIAFSDLASGREDIKQGTEIPLLVVDGILVTVAICKDFCDLGTDNPYMRLGADLVLVPSMGAAATMASHMTAAHNLAVRAGTRAFVVQQSEGEQSACFGYVLDPGVDVNGVVPEDLKKSSTWTHYSEGA